MKKYLKPVLRNEDGVVAIMFAMILPILLLLLTLSIDITRTYAISAKLAAVQEAGSLAAAVVPDDYLQSSFFGCKTDSGYTCNGFWETHDGRKLYRGEYAVKYAALNLPNGSTTGAPDPAASTIRNMAISSYFGTSVNAIFGNSTVTGANYSGNAMLTQAYTTNNKALFTNKDLNVNQGSRVLIDGTITSSPTLIGFVLDVSNSMDKPVSNTDKNKRIEALQAALGAYLEIVKVTADDKTTLPSNLEIAFADFARDSGYRLAKVINRDESLNGDGTHYYDTMLGHYYSTVNAGLFPDYIGFTNSYASIYKFIYGQSSPLFAPSIECQVANENQSIAECDNNKINASASPGDRSEGSCASCGLFKISDFFQTKTDPNVYGKLCYVPNRQLMEHDGTISSSSGTCYPGVTYQRIIILMSDGDFKNHDDKDDYTDPATKTDPKFSGSKSKKLYGNDVYRYEYPDFTCSGCNNGTVINRKARDATSKTCKILRNAGYKIIAVQFGNTDNTTFAGAMKECATGDKTKTTANVYNPATGKLEQETVYYTADTADELKKRFESLAEKTKAVSVRIVQ